MTSLSKSFNFNFWGDRPVEAPSIFENSEAENFQRFPRTAPESTDRPWTRLLRKPSGNRRLRNLSFFFELWNFFGRFFWKSLILKDRWNIFQELNPSPRHGRDPNFKAKGLVIWNFWAPEICYIAKLCGPGRSLLSNSRGGGGSRAILRAMQDAKNRWPVFQNPSISIFEVIGQSRPFQFLKIRRR